MSRQEVARAALRSLTSHAEVEEGSNQRNASLQHHQAQQYPYHYQQQSQAASTASSYFGESALQITDSPTNSPELAATHLHHFGSLPRLSKRQGESGTGTPGTSDVPSLSLSNSSFSDGPLRSPFNENEPSQNSISSTRTIQQHTYSSLQEDESRRAGAVSESTLRRIASNLQLSVDDVRRVEQHMIKEAQEPGVPGVQEEWMESMGKERYYNVVEAMQNEEDRITQIHYFRSAQHRADLPRSSFDLQSNPPAVLSPTHSRSGPLSSPPPYDSLDLWDRSARIPSPRAALESLTSTNNRMALPPFSSTFAFENSRANSNRHLYLNTSVSPYYTHTCQTSASSRPVALPDRSYRSMDDYTTQEQEAVVTSPQMRKGANAPVRRSIHGTFSSPGKHSSTSRQASRSPFIDSPKLEESDGMETEEDRRSYTAHPSTASQHLRPGPAPLRRQRYTPENDSNTFDDYSTVSRRASAEVLGQSIKRVTSPFTIPEDSGGLSASSSQPISHEEVMARLQRKVKERLAAKNERRDYSSANVLVGGRSHSVASTSATSPTFQNKHSSLPYGTQPASLGRTSGRKRPGNPATILNAPSSSSRRSLSINTRKPRKSASMKTLSRKEEEEDEEERGERKRENGEDDDAEMQDAVLTSNNGSTLAMGIEALLSAAAIADR
ncbi:hypothetical protein CBS101457_003336 [Exobasidium rhododendri]|nr:hypothetical protein CBS101457_003336 [Exobasidium rhododendri]